MEELKALRRRGPWPGPIPYDEKDRSIFFGRTADLREVLTRLQHGHILLLTAFSGVGKTSFIRAAVVPVLRVRRAEALNKEDKKRQPAVLVVRDWLGHPVTSPDEVLCQAILRSLDEKKRKEVIKTYANDPNLAAHIEEDFKALKRVTRGEGGAYEYIRSLSEVVGSLVLIFDQFEEALLGPIAEAEAILQTIARLYRNEPYVRFLISFRQEFLSNMRKLESQLSGLGREAYFLPELGVQTIREVLLESARAGRVELDEAAVKGLLSWLREAAEPLSIVSSLSTSAQGKLTTQRYEAGVSLLKLQAVLYELYQLAVGSSKKKEVRIGQDTLNQLIEMYGQTSIDGLSGGPALVRTALRRFLDRFVLPLPSLKRGEELKPPKDNMLAQRWAAAHMSPFLSSGTLKVKQLESSLIAAAWSYEWNILGIKMPKVGELLRKDTLVNWNRRALQKRLKLTEEPVGLDERVLSGRARAEAWSRVQAVEYLLKLSQQTLDRLIKGNIVRATRLAEGMAYELVHDGFSEVLTRWAEEASVINDPLSALVAPIAQRGPEFHWNGLIHNIRNVCWVGCRVGPGEQLSLDLRNIKFVDCDLRGTIFEYCVFRSGGFLGCDLSGTIFKDCEFRGSAATPFVIEGGQSNGTVFLGCSPKWVEFRNTTLDHLQWVGVKEAGHILFQDCIINHWSLDETLLRGSLHIEGISQMSQCDLQGLKVTGGQKGQQVRISDDTTLAYCRLSEALAQAAARAKSNKRYLPDKD